VGINIVSNSLLETDPPLCIIGIEYVLTYDNVPVTEISEPMKLVFLDTTDEVMLTFYDEKFPDVGYHELYIVANLENVPNRRRRILEQKFEERNLQFRANTGDVRDEMPVGDGYYGPYPPNFCDGNSFCDRTLIEIIDPCNNPFRVAA